ncbi:hypothetical protein LRS13_19860 [Svornostia abyssi]|uniref:Uncharacterized protein n=1 Tax=Svornostia abyssi TaxID=2898438 RepID=A0ABY5PE62_9ACTN|nr:hypothetical protein LRS13_19860 [Parviterribacteraceae bacterium J379]
MLDKILSNPLVGLSPWIIYSIVEGENRLEIAALLALGTALLVVILGVVRGSRPKALEFTDVTYFGILAVVIAVGSDATHDWLELWGGEVANTALVVFALGSILVRHPFTLAYAKESTPEEEWSAPEFLRANYVISWVWVLAFGIEALSGLYGDAVLDDSNNIWTGWVIQTLPLIAAAQFTIWYPQRLEALGRRAQGEDVRVPPIQEMYAQLAPWLTVIGAIVFITGDAPGWLGFVFIAAGVGLQRLFMSQAKAAERGDGPTPAPAGG